MGMTKKEQRLLDLSIIELIENGEATMDTLTTATEVNAKAVKASFMRIEGRDMYAVTDDEGGIIFVDGDKFDELEAEAATVAKKATVKKISNPQATMMRKKKAVLNKTTSYSNAQGKAAKEGASYPDALKHQIASLSLTIAQWELKELKSALIKQFNLKSVEELDEYENLDDLVTKEEEDEDEDE